jgi:Bacterial HORMA domain family 1
MSYSESLTQTFSVADIGKVIDCIAADLDMNSQSTGLLTREVVKKYAADVKSLAQLGYLVEANIMLQDSSGVTLRAAKYEVSTDASTLIAQRPGNNLWPRTPSGELGIVVRYSRKWLDLTDAQRAAFKQTLATTWTTTNTDLSFPSLTRSPDRNYVSNSWGVTKSVYA